MKVELVLNDDLELKAYIKELIKNEIINVSRTEISETVKDVLNINFKDFTGDVSVKVIDINGREVFTQKLSNVNNSNAINLEKLSTGIYILKLQGENLNYSEKVILE